MRFPVFLHPRRRAHEPASVDATGPLRLLSGGSGFERRLLESARHDQAPAGSLLRIARGLELPPGPPPEAPDGPVHASALGRHGVVTGIGTAGVLGVIVAVGWFAIGTPRDTAKPQLAEQGSASVVPVEASRGEPISGPRRTSVTPSAQRESGASAMAPPPTRTLPATHDVEPEVRRGHAPAAARPHARSAKAAHAASSGVASTPDRDLLGELRALEAVQTALHEQRPKQAEDLLGHYARRFPQGELNLEAALLQVEVAVARGERARALREAERLLARTGAGRYRARLDALLHVPVERTPQRGVKSSLRDMNGQEENR